MSNDYLVRGTNSAAMFTLAVHRGDGMCLLAMDWIGRLEEAGAQRLVLLVAPAQTLARPLLQALLAEHSASLAPLWQRSDWERLTLADLLGVDHDE